jgi:penicillin-binding protein 2
MPNILNSLIRKLRNGRRRSGEINPEDIFIDSANISGLNLDRFEGRMEKPIGERTFLATRVVMVLVAVFLAGKLTSLQVVNGNEYAAVSEANRLDRTAIFADRGVIFDRKGVPLAENSIKPDESDFAAREYAPIDGVASVVGYIKYPSRDKSGRYYDEEYHGIAGVEKVYDELLSGENGSKLTETDALGNTASESVIEAPKKGSDLTLSIDAALTQKLYQAIGSTARERGFTGGAGVIMDVATGELIALTSYPEYKSSVMTDGSDRAEIARMLTDKSTPLLNRAVSGLYTPGSIVKPIVAIGALSEGVISPEKEIVSTGKLVLPNPYNPDQPSIFKDWKAHGATDMRQAIAVSSDVYFYQVGGGFGSQKGLGITNLDKYFSLFGLDEMTGIDLPGEIEGLIATPDWKARVFPDDPDWRIGNTYHTSIGQYGTQITPVVAARFAAAIANKGTLLVPSVVYGGRASDGRVYRQIDLPAEDWKIIQEGMRRGVTHGTVTGLSNPNVSVAAKTGTAELGARKEFVNSWVIGFFPYEKPRYAFALLMEKGPVANLVGATSVFRQVLDWMAVNTPEYFE